MKFLKYSFIAFLFGSIGFAQTESSIDFKTLEDSISYSIGQNVGKNLKDPELKVNFTILAQAMKDAVEGRSRLNDEQMEKCLMALNTKIVAKRSAEMNAVKEKNKIIGDEFLAKNRTAEGVITLPSGLQYKIITTGNGAQPTSNDKVKVHYKGTLIDGREFDSSYKRNEPAVFGVTQVIKGWTEALQLMHVGDKWMLYIPSDLAYGDRGASELIQPGSTLIFEVELLDIVK
ncbi:MAG: FKBP-type peptidyl-prolyl cis-trans isomerase [Bacteroidota bacterium]